jgi:hypothetical protein
MGRMERNVGKTRNRFAFISHNDRMTHPDAGVAVDTPDIATLMTLKFGARRVSNRPRMLIESHKHLALSNKFTN